jgi:hypothetical protein
MYILKVRRYGRGNEYAFQCFVVLTIFYIVYLLALCVAWRLGLRNGYFCWNTMFSFHLLHFVKRCVLSVDNGRTSFVWSVFEGGNNFKNLPPFLFPRNDEYTRKDSIPGICFQSRTSRIQFFVRDNLFNVFCITSLKASCVSCRQFVLGFVKVRLNNFGKAIHFDSYISGR